MRFSISRGKERENPLINEFKRRIKLNSVWCNQLNRGDCDTPYVVYYHISRNGFRKNKITVHPVYKATLYNTHFLFFLI